jgi:hypothetical protein
MLPSYRNNVSILLEKLDRGEFIRAMIALVMRITVVIAVGASILLVLRGVKLSFWVDGLTNTAGILFLTIAFASSIPMAARVAVTRSGQVLALTDSPYTVTRSVTLVIRAIGEVSATVMTAIGIGGCLQIWTAGSDGDVLWPVFQAAGGLFGGLFFLIWTLFLAVAILLLCYLVAEGMIILTDIALNLRQLTAKQTPSDQQPGQDGR